MKSAADYIDAKISQLTSPDVRRKEDGPRRHHSKLVPVARVAAEISSSAGACLSRQRQFTIFSPRRRAPAGSLFCRRRDSARPLRHIQTPAVDGRMRYLPRLSVGDFGKERFAGALFDADAGDFAALEAVAPLDLGQRSGRRRRPMFQGVAQAAGFAWGRFVDCRCHQGVARSP